MAGQDQVSAQLAEQSYEWPSPGQTACRSDLIRFSTVGLAPSAGALAVILHFSDNSRRNGR